MQFPSASLLVLLKFARGQTELTPEVFDAGLEVLKYIYSVVVSKLDVKTASAPNGNVTELLEEVLDYEKSEAKGFSPTIWITIGLWVLEKVLTKVLKD
jgi:hypothetical protein